MTLVFLDKRNGKGEWIVKVQFGNGDTDTIFIPNESYWEFKQAAFNLAA